MRRLCPVVIVSAFALWGSAGEVVPRRVAVLCEQQDEALLGLVEQAEVQLSQEQGVELLDRAKIQRVWQEQALSLEQAAICETAVAMGKVLTADVLVVVGLRDDTVTWRVMNTSDGRLLRLELIRWPPQNREAVLSRAVSLTVMGIEQSRARTINPQYVAVARFVNEDLSRQYDALEEALPELLSAHLSSSPRTVMVERDELVKLAEELDRTTGAAGKYQPSMFLVEGTLRSKVEQGQVVVAARVSVGAPGKSGKTRFECVGTGSDMAGLSAGIAERLVKEMGSGNARAAQPMLSDEAEAFYRKGVFFNNQKAYVAALRLYETASVLAPTNEVYRQAVTASRQMALSWKLLPPETMLTRYIQEASECERVFRNNLSTVTNCLVWSPWQKPHLINAVAYDSPCGEKKREACKAYFSVLDAAEEWHKARKLPLHEALPESLENALFEGTVIEGLEYYDRCVRRLIDWYAADKKTQDMLHGFLLRLAQRMKVSSVGGVADEQRNEYQDRLLGELARDGRPLVSLLANAVLSEQYWKHPNWAFRPDAKERAQEAIRRLALWTEPGLPPGEIYRNLTHAMASGGRDLSPLIGAMREALKAPGAQYSSALDGLIGQIFGYADAGISFLPYRDWSDLLVLHLAHRLPAGTTPAAGPAVAYVEALAKRIITSETQPTMTPAALDCVAEINRFMESRGLALPVPEVPKPPVPVVADPAQTVAWSVDLWKLIGAKYDSDSPRAALVVGDQTAYLALYHGDRQKHILTICEIDLQTGVVRSDVASVSLPPPFIRFPFTKARMVGRQVVLESEPASYLYDPQKGLRPAASVAGFPAGEITSACTLNGRSFVGCRGGFGEWSDETEQLSMICSSRVADGRYPLSGSNQYDVVAMAADHQNNRLLLMVREIVIKEMGDGTRVKKMGIIGPRNGLWEYAVATGAMRHVVPIPDHDISFDRCATDMNYVYADCGGKCQLVYDIASPSNSLAFVSATERFFPSRIPGSVPCREIRKVPKAVDFVHLWPMVMKDGDLIYKDSWADPSAVLVWPRGAEAGYPVRVVDRDGKDLVRKRHASDEVKELIPCRYGALFRSEIRIGLIPFPLRAEK